MKKNDIAYNLGLLLDYADTRTFDAFERRIREEAERVIVENPCMMYLLRYTLELSLNSKKDGEVMLQALEELTDRYKPNDRKS